MAATSEIAACAIKLEEARVKHTRRIAALQEELRLEEKALSLVNAALEAYKNPVISDLLSKLEKLNGDLEAKLAEQKPAEEAGGDDFGSVHSPSPPSSRDVSPVKARRTKPTAAAISPEPSIPATPETVVKAKRVSHCSCCGEEGRTARGCGSTHDCLKAKSGGTCVRDAGVVKAMIEACLKAEIEFEKHPHTDSRFPEFAHDDIKMETYHRYYFFACNVSGSQIDTGTVWLRRVLAKGGRTICCILGCEEEATIGMHVWLRIGNQKSYFALPFILPGCAFHNSTEGPLEPPKDGRCFEGLPVRRNLFASQRVAPEKIYRAFKPAPHAWEGGEETGEPTPVVIQTARAKRAARRDAVRAAAEHDQ
jgi:hypothetical protein